MDKLKGLLDKVHTKEDTMYAAMNAMRAHNCTVTRKRYNDAKKGYEELVREYESARLKAATLLMF